MERRTQVWVMTVEPRTLGPKMAILKVILSHPPSKRAEESERYLLNGEGLMQKYEVLIGKPLNEYLGAQS